MESRSTDPFLRFKKEKTISLHFCEYSTYTLTDLVNIERAKKGKIYDGDCIIIQVSATKGQCFYIPHPQEIENKYVVLTRKPNAMVNMYYLYSVVDVALPAFLEVYQTGLNIQPSIFDFMKIEVHSYIRTQNYIAELMTLFDKLFELENRLILDYQDFKEWHLHHMFPQLEKSEIESIDEEIDPHYREMQEEQMLVKKRREPITETLRKIGIETEAMPYPFLMIIYNKLLGRPN